MHLTPGALAALIAATSFAAGINVYATALTLGLLARFGWVALPAGLHPLTHTGILIVAGVLFAAEFVADKIPALDLVWNALHTVIRIPVAGLLAWQATAQLSPMEQILAAGAGAAIAAVAHTSKTAVRAAVTPSPEPVSNIALSTVEDAGAIGLTWLATHHPFVAGGIALALLVGALLTVRYLVRAVRRSWARRPAWLLPPQEQALAAPRRG